MAVGDREHIEKLLNAYKHRRYSDGEWYIKTIPDITKERIMEEVNRQNKELHDWTNRNRKRPY